MFWLHHPQPVRPRKAVAEQTVKSQVLVPMDKNVIVIEKIPAASEDPDCHSCKDKTGNN